MILDPHDALGALGLKHPDQLGKVAQVLEEEERRNEKAEREAQIRAIPGPVAVGELQAFAQRVLAELAKKGLAFKPDIDDLRESPAVEIARKVRELCPDARLLAVEPHIAELPSALDSMELAHWEEAVAEADIVAVLETYQSPSKWRMEVTERPDGVTVINDAYNANPESMRADLKALVAMGNQERRTWAVIGELRERRMARSRARNWQRGAAAQPRLWPLTPRARLRSQA
jgi:UDP-N-acetylmuramoylalanine-D-glutamate ligase